MFTGSRPFDITHRGMINYLWELPFGRGRKFLNATDSMGARLLNGAVGGWNISGTTTLRGGQRVRGSVRRQLLRNWISIGQGRIPGRVSPTSEFPMPATLRPPGPGGIRRHDSPPPT